MPAFISCLQSSYGRYTCVCRTLACFLRQTYPYKKLLILNNHPVPLSFDHPEVQIFNEPGYPTLGDCRQRLLELCDTEFLRTFDDDDFYGAADLQIGMTHINGYDAWKPARSWMTNGGQRFELQGNAMEASITYRTEAVRRVGGYRASAGDEHGPLLAHIHVEEKELGVWSPYCYTWGIGQWHISRSLGSDTIENRTRIWKEKNHDVRVGEPLVPDFAHVDNWWRKVSQFVDEDIRAQWLATFLGDDKSTCLSMTTTKMMVAAVDPANSSPQPDWHADLPGA